MDNGVRGANVSSSDFDRAIQGWRLATAEITYWMPDHPNVLQSFIWQQLDLAPEYPKLQKFLAFWRENIEATLHSVTVAAGKPLAPARMRSAKAVYRLN